MHVHLIVLLEPGLHLRPFECHVVAQQESIGRWVRIPPRGVLRRPVPRPDRPAPDRPLVGARRRVGGGDEDLGPHVRQRKVVDREPAGLAEKQHALAVGHDLAAEADPDPARARLELVLVGRGRDSGWCHRFLRRHGAGHGSGHPFAPASDRLVTAAPRFRPELSTVSDGASSPALTTRGVSAHRRGHADGGAWRGPRSSAAAVPPPRTMSPRCGRRPRAPKEESHEAVLARTGRAARARPRDRRRGNGSPEGHAHHRHPHRRQHPRPDHGPRGQQPERRVLGHGAAPPARRTGQSQAAPRRVLGGRRQHDLRLPPPEERQVPQRRAVHRAGSGVQLEAEHGEAPGQQIDVRDHRAGRPSSTTTPSGSSPRSPTRSS